MINIEICNIYLFFLDIGPIEQRILENLWTIHSLFPQDDECVWVQEHLDKDEENLDEDDLENLDEENLENLDEGDLENMIAEYPEEEDDKEEKKSVVEEDQEDLDDEDKNLDEGVQETLNKANQESFNMCMNLLKSSQSAMRLAVSEWNGLLVKMNRRCRTVVH